MTSIPSRADAVIVGAGIAGLCTALPLAKAGRTVVVLDRGAAWGDASGANAGTLSLQVKRPEVLHVTRRAIELWQAMRAELGADVGFAKPGGLRVATSEKELGMLRGSMAVQASLGLETEWLEGNRLRDAAPWLGPSVRAATWCDWDALSSPLLAGRALLAAARRRGVTVQDQAEVTAIAALDRGYRVTTAAGTVDCAQLVIAAGAWTGKVAALLGVDLPVDADVNMLSVTEPAPPLLDKVVTHMGGVLSLKQYPNGTVMIGGGWQGRGSHQSMRRETDHLNLLHNMRVACAIVPALKDLRLVRSWAGFEGVASDALPLLGALPGRPGAFVNACARGGYSQGPALGEQMAELMLTGRTSLDVARFDPARFAAAGAHA
ncbi:MAG: FAD-binding oxidoreductase [Alphaproteobacteria bacterium]|nr:FAD-binding oxidoreductase [Alphaproteobacteria bacterium]